MENDDDEANVAAVFISDVYRTENDAIRQYRSRVGERHWSEQVREARELLDRVQEDEAMESHEWRQIMDSILAHYSRSRTGYNRGSE